MVVAPWGEVILDAGEAVGVSYANLDLTRIKSARESISAWSTITDFAAP
jgi:predicted amidohydrolase